MKRKITILLTVGLILCTATIAMAQSASKSFRLSVIIPPHAGNGKLAKAMTTAPKSSSQEYQRQEVLRNNKPVVLETYVVK